MKKDKQSLPIVVLALVFCIFSMALVMTLFKFDDAQSTEKLFTSYNTTITNSINELINNQQKKDEEINKYIGSTKYTINNPYVVANPYEIAPLSAIIIFTTDTKSSVAVYVNDTYLYEVASTNNHVIPVYGLYANSINYIKLVTSDGLQNTVEITTDALDRNILNFDVQTSIGDQSQFFLLGNMKTQKPSLRAFDYNGNLVFYLNYNYITSYAWGVGNRLFVGYSPKNNYNKSHVTDLCLEIDYLGKIYNITTDTSTLNYDYNYATEDEVYRAEAHTMLETKVANFNPTSINIEKANLDLTQEIKTSTIQDELINSENIYEDYSLTTNLNRIDISLPDYIGKKVSLLLVSKTGITYQYLLSLNNNFSSTIYTDLKGEYALYINVDKTYYNLLTTIKN